MTYNVFLVLILLVALLLVLIIMVQNPKGGGLSSSFGGQGGGQNIGGVQSTNKFLDKSTWTLAVALFALILLSNYSIDRGGSSGKSQLENTIENRVIEVEDTNLEASKEDANESEADSESK